MFKIHNIAIAIHPLKLRRRHWYLQSRYRWILVWKCKTHYHPNIAPRARTRLVMSKLIISNAHWKTLLFLWQEQVLRTNRPGDRPDGPLLRLAEQLGGLREPPVVHDFPILPVRSDLHLRGHADQVSNNPLWCAVVCCDYLIVNSILCIWIWPNVGRNPFGKPRMKCILRFSLQFRKRSIRIFKMLHSQNEELVIQIFPKSAKLAFSWKRCRQKCRRVPEWTPYLNIILKK